MRIEYKNLTAEAYLERKNFPYSVLILLFFLLDA